MLLSTLMFVEQDAELGRLRQVVVQLKEKEKASGRVEKLVKDLEGA